jgi:hypothetical protein
MVIVDALASAAMLKIGASVADANRFELAIFKDVIGQF